jgi:hypothetical protein
VEKLTVAKSIGVLSLSLCSLENETSFSENLLGETRASEIFKKTSKPQEKEIQEPTFVVSMFGTEQSQKLSK